MVQVTCMQALCAHQHYSHRTASQSPRTPSCQQSTQPWVRQTARLGRLRHSPGRWVCLHSWPARPRWAPALSGCQRMLQGSAAGARIDSVSTKAEPVPACTAGAGVGVQHSHGCQCTSQRCFATPQAGRLSWGCRCSQERRLPRSCHRLGCCHHRCSRQPARRHWRAWWQGCQCSLQSVSSGIST